MISDLVMNMHQALGTAVPTARRRDHRPWPRPRGPWIVAQRWSDLLFAHWPVPVEEVRRLVPPALPLDTFDGWAWVGVVPFRMSGVRPRALPSLPGLSAFPELNVRTYVTRDGKPGVWFFSLDAGNRMAVEIGRRWFHLPYFHARMSVARHANDSDAEHVRPAVASAARATGHRAADAIVYRSDRTHRGAPRAALRVRYRPVGAPYRAPPESLDDWLTARYCLYALDGRGRVCRTEIDHAPWPLQPAVADFPFNSMAAATGIRLPDVPPLLHFARRLDVIAWPPHPIGPKS